MAHMGSSASGLTAGLCNLFPHLNAVQRRKGGKCDVQLCAFVLGGDAHALYVTGEFYIAESEERGVFYGRESGTML